MLLDVQTLASKSSVRSSVTLRERACNVYSSLSKPSLILDRHILQAAKRPLDLDERQVNAVDARMELDLRIGAAFSRMQTFALKALIETVQELKAISYGMWRETCCQKSN